MRSSLRSGMRFLPKSMYSGMPNTGRKTIGSIHAILKAEEPSWLIMYRTVITERTVNTVCTWA